MNSSNDPIEWFKGNLTNLLDSVNILNNDFKYATLNRTPNTHTTTGNTITSMDTSFASSLSSPIYWMLQDPIDEEKFYFNKSLVNQITNRQIDLYNRAAIEIL